MASMASGDGLPGSPGRRRARYGGEYESYGDYGPAEEPPTARRDLVGTPTAAPPPRVGTVDPPRAPDRLRGRLRCFRSPACTSRATVSGGARACPPSPRPSVVRTIGPTTAARAHGRAAGLQRCPGGAPAQGHQPVILNLQGLPAAAAAADRLLERPRLCRGGPHAARRRPGVPAHAQQRRVSQEEKDRCGAGPLPTLTVRDILPSRSPLPRHPRRARAVLSWFPCAAAPSWPR
jgi:hypothetical protein